MTAAFAAALSGLPGMGPATLVRILADYEPDEAWRAVVAGRLSPPSRRRRPAVLAGPGALAAGPGQETLAVGRAGPGGQDGRRWAVAAGRVDPPRWWAPFAAQGIGVTWPGRPDFPIALAGDPHPPGVLFWRGRLEVLDRVCVAVVGTRNATPDGRAVAFELGRDLTAAGICVVSGLALGIDGAAHAGALDARARAEARGEVSGGVAAGPIGVAASGVDVAYPRRHAVLWERVVAEGVILSETLPGRPAEAWRFPTRNRIIAGLSRLVVVVESHTCGGSLITAEAAIERGIEVRVVPGPVHSPASAGSNQLLYDGPGPVRHARDVLDALGVVLPDRRSQPIGPDGSGGDPDSGALSGANPGPRPGVRPGAKPGPGVGPGLGSSSAPAGASGAGSGANPGSGTGADAGLDSSARAVLDALGWRPATMGQVMARTGLAAGTVARRLEELAARRLISEESGWWNRA